MILQAARSTGLKIADGEWRFGKLTAIHGENGGGKTEIATDLIHLVLTGVHPTAKDGYAETKEVERIMRLGRFNATDQITGELDFQDVDGIFTVVRSFRRVRNEDGSLTHPRPKLDVRPSGGKPLSGKAAEAFVAQIAATTMLFDLGEFLRLSAKQRTDRLAKIVPLTGLLTEDALWRHVGAVGLDAKAWQDFWDASADLQDGWLAYPPEKLPKTPLEEWVAGQLRLAAEVKKRQKALAEEREGKIQACLGGPRAALPSPEEMDALKATLASARATSDRLRSESATSAAEHKARREAAAGKIRVRREAVARLGKVREQIRSVEAQTSGEAIARMRAQLEQGEGVEADLQRSLEHCTATKTAKKAEIDRLMAEGRTASARYHDLRDMEHKTHEAIQTARNDPEANEAETRLSAAEEMARRVEEQAQARRWGHPPCPFCQAPLDGERRAAIDCYLAELRAEAEPILAPWRKRIAELEEKETRLLAEGATVFATTTKCVATIQALENEIVGIESEIEEITGDLNLARTSYGNLKLQLAELTAAGTTAALARLRQEEETLATQVTGDPVDLDALDRKAEEDRATYQAALAKASEEETQARVALTAAEELVARSGDVPTHQAEAGRARQLMAIATRVTKALGPAGLQGSVMREACAPLLRTANSVVGDLGQIDLLLEDEAGNLDFDFVLRTGGGWVSQATLNRGARAMLLAGLKVGLAQQLDAPWRLLHLDDLNEVSLRWRLPLLDKLVALADAEAVDQVIVAGCMDSLAGLDNGRWTTIHAGGGR